MGYKRDSRGRFAGGTSSFLGLFAPKERDVKPGPQFQQLKLPGMEHIAHHFGMPGPQPHLRFGDWPEDERSHNNVTGHKEEGVSVYDLHPHTNEPMDPDPHLESEGAEWALDGMQNRMRDWQKGHHPGYVVSGKLAGIGHDGEPTLRNLQHLQDWSGPSKYRSSRPRAEWDALKAKKT